MKVVVRNPSLPVLVGGILLGLAVRKEERILDRRTARQGDTAAGAFREGGMLEQLRSPNPGETIGLPAHGGDTR